MLSPQTQSQSQHSLLMQQLQAKTQSMQPPHIGKQGQSDLLSSLSTYNPSSPSKVSQSIYSNASNNNNALSDKPLGNYPYNFGAELGANSGLNSRNLGSLLPSTTGLQPQLGSPIQNLGLIRSPAINDPAKSLQAPDNDRLPQLITQEKKTLLTDPLQIERENRKLEVRNMLDIRKFLTVNGFWLAAPLSDLYI